MSEKLENNCLYYLPTRSTPIAEKNTDKEYFCDQLLQERIVVPLMKKESPKNPNIDCCNDPDNCPRYTPETQNSYLFKK